MAKAIHLALWASMLIFVPAVVNIAPAQVSPPASRPSATSTTSPATQTAELEPYLKQSLEGLVEQFNNPRIAESVRHRALMRLAQKYPDQAPDALLPTGREEAAELLFRLGRPNSKTQELLAEIDQGRTHWTLESIVAKAQALSWPGNKAAIPTLQRMIDENWDTANEARLCIARIQDTDGPKALLALPYYLHGNGGRSSVNYAARVSQLLRALADPRTNDALLSGGDPANAMALWGQEGFYALAWPGNKALADAYLKTKDPYARFHIAAARTRDPRCLKVIREKFEKEAAEFLQADLVSRGKGGFRWICIAGAEVADDGTTDTLAKLLVLADLEKKRVQADLQDRVRRGERIWGQIDPDPLGSVREAVLRGLCVNPLPRTKELVTPYLADYRSVTGELLGIALLRAGEPEGLACLLDDRRFYTSKLVAEEAFLLYSGQTLLDRSGDGGLPKARAWCDQNKDDPRLRHRIAEVNKSGLAQSLVEPLMLWP